MTIETELYLDLEGTLINTELDPTIIFNNKDGIDYLIKRYNIKIINIFSSIIPTISEAMQFQCTLQKSIDKAFGFRINASIVIDDAWDAFREREQKADDTFMKKPMKDSLFVAWVERYGKPNTRYILVDDTVSNRTLNVNGNEVLIIRGNSDVNADLMKSHLALIDSITSHPYTDFQHNMPTENPGQAFYE